MADRLVPIFWLSLAAAVPVAFVASPGRLRWVAIGWLGLVGRLFSLANWLTIVAVVVRKRSSSMVPLVGGLLLCLAVGAIPLTSIRLYAPLGLVVDPWIPAMLWALLWSSRRSGHDPEPPSD